MKKRELEKGVFGMCSRVRAGFWEEERVAEQGFKLSGLSGGGIHPRVPGGVGAGTLGQKPANVVLVLLATVHV